MENYRKGKKRIKVNDLGSLYVDYNKISDEKRPIIYIGGQMEHRFHILEQTGYTFDPGHNMFDGSWFYDYSIFNDKCNCNAINFGNNLLKALEIADIGEVDLITESYGGLIGAYASQSPKIHKVVAIHPPILGSPLANPELVNIALKTLDLKQKVIAKIVSRLIDSDFGFEKENKSGLLTSYLWNATDLSKLLVVSSSINIDEEKNNVVKELYRLIMEISKEHSDGIVVFDKDGMDYLGINYLEDDTPTNHFEAGSRENIEKVYKKVFK